MQEIQAQRERALIIWDESVLDRKARKSAAERLCAVRSTKAVRLKRIKPHQACYCNPPGGSPVFVPGFHWLQVLVIGPKGPPSLAHLRWWTTRGPAPSQARTEEAQVFDEVDQRWGKDCSPYLGPRPFCWQSLVDPSLYARCTLYPTLAQELQTLE